MSNYQFCVCVLFMEATIFVLVGCLAGALFGSWQAVVAAQGIVMGAEWVGYRIEGYLHRRSSVEGCRW